MYLWFTVELQKLHLLEVVLKWLPILIRIVCKIVQASIDEKFPFSDVLKFSQTYQVNSCKIGLIQNIGAVSIDDTDFISFLLYFLGHGPTPLDYYRTPTT